MKSHRFHPEANEEYATAAAHSADIRAELGGRFYDEIERLIAEACAAPNRFRRFPYALLYLDEPDNVWIVAIMPLKRDPDSWRHRLVN